MLLGFASYLALPTSGLPLGDVHGNGTSPMRTIATVFALFAVGKNVKRGKQSLIYA